jgi:hypothetical protein
MESISEKIRYSLFYGIRDKTVCLLTGSNLDAPLIQCSQKHHTVFNHDIS